MFLTQVVVLSAAVFVSPAKRNNATIIIALILKSLDCIVQGTVTVLKENTLVGGGPKSVIYEYNLNIHPSGDSHGLYGR